MTLSFHILLTDRRGASENPEIPNNTRATLFQQKRRARAAPYNPSEFVEYWKMHSASHTLKLYSMAQLPAFFATGEVVVFAGEADITNYLVYLGANWIAEDRFL